MTILSVLYTLIITPLELLFEVIFTIADRIIGNAGLSIIFLSLAVNFLVLPLYKRADELQAEERDIQAKMAPRIKHIKSTFKGDERFFMLQEYYRINHYKPVYALKSSISLLLQIPFFIAAYNLLSGMAGLKGMPFGFISDLGKEDAMFTIGSFPVNVLPILMTLINIVSGIIYTKGHPLRAKIQVYGLAAVFLVLLYGSPSGLVFYWLLNNVFSLVKNIFYKLKNPKKALNIVLAVSGVALILLTVFRNDLDVRQKVLLSVGGILLSVPLTASLLKIERKPNTDTKDNFVSFLAGAILMALITGLLIPSTIINDSVLEFIDVFQLANPVFYVINTLLLSFGSWVLWGTVFYMFMDAKTRNIFSKAIWIICGISIADYMLFGTKLGNLSSTLQYDLSPAYEIKDYLINVLAIAGICVVLGFIHSKSKAIPKTILIIGILAVTCFGMLNTAGILGVYSGYLEYTKLSVEKPSISLSRNGKNVIILMLDRAMGTQVPYIFNEKPELKEKFDGFTYYPNTISYGGCTIVGTPALYGGYEYTPVSMNERTTETMKEKHTQALKLLPVLFSNNGYQVTICDPPFAGYQFTPDLSIYSDHPEFRCYTTLGALSYFGNDGSDSSINVMARVNNIRNRNFFFFSLMKISPLILQETIYDGGLYNEPVAVSDEKGDSSDSFALVQTYEDSSKSTGYNMYFLNAYVVLSNLSNITEINDSNENTYLAMDNDTTHYPCYLQQPGYVPKAKVDNTNYDVNMVERYTVNGVTMDMSNIDQRRHYHVNMAAFLKLSEWFDYLRANGVYDNTRIILVADHGRNLGQFGITSNGQDMEFFMPLLMVKDFNAKGFTTSDNFMTNADVPTLATSGLINNPVNPFTGKPINSDAKHNPQTVIYTPVWSPSDLEGTRFPESDRYVISGGKPHDPNNWKYIGAG